MTSAEVKLKIRTTFFEIILSRMVWQMLHPKSAHNIADKSVKNRNKTNFVDRNSILRFQNKSHLNCRSISWRKKAILVRSTVWGSKTWKIGFSSKKGSFIELRQTFWVWNDSLGSREYAHKKLGSVSLKAASIEVKISL